MRSISVGSFTVTDKMREYVNDVLDTGRISYGNYSRRLEHDFAHMHDCAYGVLSNSGTSSLQVALQALKIKHGWHDGDQVIVPATTFVATINIILHNNLTPVLVDVDPLYYEIDDELIDDVITDRTRAIIPVHLFGQPCDMTRINAIAKHYNLAIIEDSCECMCVSHAGRRVGSWGDIGCFSTYVAHLLTTGVGGIATTNDKELAVLMRSLVNHGRDGIYISIDDDDKHNTEVIAKRFKFDHIGHSYRITELEAALGLAQLNDLPDIIEQRQFNATYLIQQLDSLKGKIKLPSVRHNAEHAWMMFPIVLYHEPKDKLTEFLESRGIETRSMLPLINQPCYKGMWNPKDYRVAEWIDTSGFYVGCMQSLQHDDLDYIVDMLREYFK